MDRRSFFKMLGCSGALVAAASVKAAPAEVAPKAKGIPVGHVRVTYYAVPVNAFTNPSPHAHSFLLSAHDCPPHGHSFPYTGGAMAAIAKREIFDGEKYVDFDSPEGCAVWNGML